MTPAARERRQVQLPVLALTAAAWIALTVKPDGTSLVGSCCPPVTVRDALTPDSVAMLMARNPPAALALGWALMLVAMMAPLLAAPVRHVLDRSLPRRRPRAVLLFVASYLAIWMVAGAMTLALGLTARLLMPTSFLPAVVGFGLALVWQCSPLKQRCLNRGHAHPELAAFGRAADGDALRFGLTHGVWCVGSCWALMLLPELLSRGHLVAMAAVTLWLVAERLDRPMPPRWHLRPTGKAARLAVAQTRTLLQRG